MPRAYFGLYETCPSHRHKSKVVCPILLDKSLRKIQIMNLIDFYTTNNTCFELNFLKLWTNEQDLWVGIFLIGQFMTDFFKCSSKFYLKIIIKIDICFIFCILMWYLICPYAFLKFISWFLTNKFYPLIKRTFQFYLLTEWHQRCNISAELPKISIFRGRISFIPYSETFFSFAFSVQWIHRNVCWKNGGKNLWVAFICPQCPST